MHGGGEEKQLSQAMLAKQSGVSSAVICYRETDRSEPTAVNIVKLAEFFDVGADSLPGLTD